MERLEAKKKLAVILVQVKKIIYNYYKYLGKGRCPAIKSN
jgi:hypothetical protein